MAWNPTPNSAPVFVVWDPYVSQPISCQWDGVYTIWDNAATTWDGGNTLWGDRPTTWIE